MFQEPLLAVATCGEGVLLARPGRGQRQRIAALIDFGVAVVRGDDIHERTRPGAFNPAWPAAGRNQVIPVILVESRITPTATVRVSVDAKSV